MVPDDHNIKYKKAFYTIQEIMDDIVNDSTVCTGLDGYNIVNDNVFLKSCTGTLREQIAKRLNTTDASPSGDNIETTNGMIWYIPNVSFSLKFADEGSSETITVSFDKNKAYDNNSASVESDPNGIFKITINANGKVTPGGSLGANLLKKNPTED